MAAGEATEGIPGGFVEITLEGIWSEKLDLDIGAAEEGAHEPSELGAKEGVSANPREEGEKG